MSHPDELLPIAVFERGPRDGTIMAMPDLPPIWRFPTPPPLAYVTADDMDGALCAMRIEVYELATAYGSPSRDDLGRYRYQHKGTR